MSDEGNTEYGLIKALATYLPPTGVYPDILTIKGIFGEQIEYVPVVRCKDCKYWHNDGIMTTCDKNIGNGYDAEYYCANGERKDGESE